MARANEKKKSETVKVGSVSLTIYPVPRPDRNGAEYWKAIYYDLKGNRRYITRSSKSELKTAARAKAREIHNQTFDLATLSEEQARLCRAFLDLKPTWDDIAFLKRNRTSSSITLTEVIALFMAAKEQGRGLSRQNIKTLTSHLSRLEAFLGGGVVFSSITVAHLDEWLTSHKKIAARTRNNLRDSLITLWRWAKKKEHLPQDALTAAEKTEEGIVSKKIPDTFTPEQLDVLIANVSEKYRTWILLQAWGCFRTDELFPLANSEKSPLDWSDINLERNIIIVRPETDKNGNRRIVPISPTLSKALKPLMQPSGRITPLATPSSSNKPETKRLGALIGGWGKNPLRHSAISYRCAFVGVAQTAMESGNSESEIKKSYLDMKSKEEAEKWFRCAPKAHP